MAFTVILSPVPLRSPEFSASRNNSPKPIIYFTRKRPVLSFAATQEQPTATPEIQLEFIGPKPEGDGMYPVDRAAAVSGEKLLRTIMSDNKLELYGTPKNKHNSSLSDLERDMGLIPDILGQLCALSVEGGKVMNCGGGGSCGTCIVEMVEGQELLNERTNTELKYLKKKPETWRLACQTIVGNKENSGKVVIQRLPQWKK